METGFHLLLQGGPLPAAPSGPFGPLCPRERVVGPLLRQRKVWTKDGKAGGRRGIQTPHLVSREGYFLLAHPPQPRPQPVTGFITLPSLFF